MIAPKRCQAMRVGFVSPLHGCLASLRDQAPAYRKSWTSRMAD